MSLLQNQDFVIYRIRSRYLQCVKDGVGERLITVNPASLNVPAFKNAGWGAEIKRTYSPPIPTGSAAGEYFANSYAAKTAYDASVTPVTGFGPFGAAADDAAGPALARSADAHDAGLAKLGRHDVSTRAPTRRMREVREDDDSSDMSDDSDDDENASGDKPSKIQFDFSKKEIPVRPRAGSSPLRNAPQVLVTSPSSHKTRPRGRVRGGSHGDVELKSSAHDNTLPPGDEDLLSSGVIAQQERIHAEIANKLRSSPNSSLPREADFDSGDESDASSAMSSDFIETADSNPGDNSLAPQPRPVAATSPGVLNALPPPIRPVSQIQPVSLLTRLLKAKEAEADNPMDAYRSFSGKGELTPIYLKLYIPFSKQATPFEIILNRFYKEEDGRTRETTVAEAIGFALYRYLEEKKEPALKDEQCDINRWTLRMVDDGEPDEDFPPLERTQPVTAYMTKKAPRGRLGAVNKEVKMEGEFALVEATQEQYVENARVTPHKTPRKSSVTPSLTPSVTPSAQSITPSTTASSEPSAMAPPLTIAGPSARQAAMDSTSTITTITSASTSASTISAPRTGIPKTVRIHVNGVDPSSPAQPPLSFSVTTDTYIAEIFEQACRKKNVDKRGYVLRISSAPGVVAPLDRTVASLADRLDLDLVRRRFVSASEGIGDRPGSPSTLDSPSAPLNLAGASTTTTSTSTTAAAAAASSSSNFNIINNNNSLVGGGGGTPGRTPKKAKFLQPAIWTPDMLSSRDYLKFTVWRKASMSFMSRHERILAIDGEYVHVMPSDQKTLLNAFESQSQAKTRSIHISTIIGTKTYRKAPASFKILVWRASREQKRYDFEAMSEKEAAEVVDALRQAIQAYRMDHPSMG